MTLLNSNRDVQPLMNPRSALSEIKKQLDARHEALLTTLDNLAGMAQRARDRAEAAQHVGDAEAARRENASAKLFLDTAKPYWAELNEIENLRVHR